MGSASEGRVAAQSRAVMISVEVGSQKSRWRMGSVGWSQNTATVLMTSSSQRRQRALPSTPMKAAIPANIRMWMSCTLEALVDPLGSGVGGDDDQADHDQAQRQCQQILAGEDSFQHGSAIISAHKPLAALRNYPVGLAAEVQFARFAVVGHF